jgi:tetratricopeptide (TPR) repeat protein
MQQLLGWFSAFLAEAYLRSGRADEARQRAQRALEVTDAVRFRYGSGLSQRALGRIRQAAGELDDAATWLREALRSFQTIQAPFEVARTRVDLAHLAHARGEDTEAARQLAEACRAFHELRVHKPLERARRLAEEWALPLAPVPPA